MAGGAKKKRVARGSKKKKKKGSPRDVVADLTDDVLVDILSRLPIKSLCRCKLVSKRWCNLISHPEHRKKLPQTIVGFFHESYNESRFPKSARHFTNISRALVPFIDPALSFLPEYKSINMKDSSNGLLLCHCWKHTDPVTMDNVVCNPATEKWVIVPDSGWSSKVKITRLGFDPAVSSHFHVFEFIPDDIWYREIEGGIYVDGENEETSVDGRIEVVAVYTSKTGVWSLNKIDEDNLPVDHCYFAFPQDGKGVFFNGFLHLVTFYSMLLTIDVEGNVLRGIPIPKTYYDDEDPHHVYLSQGHLYLANVLSNEESGDYRLSVWVLEDYNSENWTLKYNVDSLHLFGAGGRIFRDISVHPEHDMIYMVCGRKLMSYAMDHMRLRFISRLGWDCEDPYIPYVPLFLESLADDEQQNSYLPSIAPDC